MRCGCLLLGILVAVPGALAQVNIASITGTVTDPSGAAIVDAAVSLTNEDTGVVLSTRTNEVGAYLFTPLQPGRYRLKAESQGFKTVERGGIVLQVGDRLAVNFSMELGAVTETVEVTAESPLLVTTNANVGLVIDRLKILELPLPGRNPLRLVQLAPGVGGRSASLGDLRFGGGRVRQVEYYVDGSPTSASGDGRAVALPSIDAIQEFRVETNNLPAEYGRVSGGGISIVTRSGTNEFHGALYEFMRDDVFNANGWDANRRGSPKGKFGLHYFGGAVGGPVILPGLYNGRNRTFFFFNFDGRRQYDEGSLRFGTVPTELERAGDFSQTLNSAGNKVTIFDPLTYDAQRNARSPFPGNRIPPARFDPVAAYMMDLWPLPNRPGDPKTGANNYAGVTDSEARNNDFTARLDQNFGSNHRVYARVTRKEYTSIPSYWAGPATDQTRHTWDDQTGGTLNWTWTASPTLVLTAHLGATVRDNTYYPIFQGFDPTKVPFAPNARALLDPRFIPRMTFERVMGLGVVWRTTWLRERHFIGSASLTKVWNRHTFKAGYEFRPLYLNNTEPAAPSGQASFDGRWTGLNQQAPFSQQGSGLASYLLGLPNFFSFDSSKLGWAVGYRYHALYAQDDIKLTQKLTLNLGLRWEYEAPMTERYDRLAFIDYGIDNGYRVNPSWDFTRDVIGKNQLPAGVPVPDLAAPFRGGMGLVTMPGMGRGNTEPFYGAFGPRLGLAYQLDDKTVLRTGFGVISAGYTGNASGTSSLSLQPFFRDTGGALITEDNGRTYRATLTNPFPGGVGIIPGTNDPKEVIAKSIGASYYGYERGHRPSYDISYNFGVQRQVGRWLLEGSFVGNRGVHLYMDGNPYVSTLPPEYLSLGALLEKPVTNPFYNAGLPENGYIITRPTIPYKYLLKTRPHLVGDVRVLRRPSGNSQYLGGFFRVERRFAQGLSVLVSYTVSKLIEDTNGKASSRYALPQDGVSVEDIRGLSVQDIPQKLVATFQYELPVGRNKAVLGTPQGTGLKVLEGILGGWRVGGFWMIQSGYPLQITQKTQFPSGLGYGPLRPTLVGDYHAGTPVRDAVGFPGQAQARYLRKEAFAVTPKYEFGTVPHVLPDLRQPRFNQLDLAIMKNFRLGEQRYIQVRLEAENFLNHPVFELGNNEQNIEHANFGYFNATANSPRNMQFGARFVF